MLRCRIFTSILVLAVVLSMAPAAWAQPETGAADFTVYVAVGDSLTAGFSSGGLARDEQEASYPNLLHAVATDAAGGFEQPLVSEPGLPPQLVLRGLAPVLITPSSGMGEPINLNLPRPYNNLGVPGARVHDVLATVTDDGGLHDVVLRGQGTALEQAIGLSPTFATLWIGNNDVLAAATSGVVIEGVTLTPQASFNADFNAVAQALGSLQIPLVLATIPDVTTIPFVTTIPPVVVDPASGEPILIDGQPVPLIGPQGPLGADDHVLLTASGPLAQGVGIPTALGGNGQPLPNQVVLDAAETEAIVTRTAAFNQIIATAATQVGAAVVDANALLERIATEGFVLGGVEFSTEFLTGGIFSYDGVHPTRLGYGIVANEFVRTINRSFGASIPPVDLSALAFGAGGATESIAAGRWLAARQATGSGFVFSRKAWRNLRMALGLDHRAKAPRHRPRAPERLPGLERRPQLPMP